jgi:hypothetical protein
MLIHTIRTPLFDDDGQLEGIIGFAMDARGVKALELQGEQASAFPS